MTETVTLSIEKLIHGGQGLARHGGRTFFIWNALPGETVEARILTSKKSFSEGIAEKILAPSPHRQKPRESFFLATSSWDIMDGDYEQEQKLAIARETYRRLGNLELPDDIALIQEGSLYHYRNKVLFRFTTNSQGEVVLAFHERESRRLIPASEGSSLALPALNQYALAMQEWLRQEQVPIQELNALLVRCNLKGECIAALFLKKKRQLPLPAQCQGLHLFSSKDKNPLAKPGRPYFSQGKATLTEEIRGRRFTYGLFSFFQVHVPLYEKVLDTMAASLQGVSVQKATEMYSGVGSIGLSLQPPLNGGELIEISREGAWYAKENNRQHKGSFVARCLPAEQALDAIISDRGLILDPPRQGLDKKVTTKILEEQPPWILYMSCDIATHARDLGQLQEQYTIVHHSLYNFFPRTPHIEALTFLKKR